MTVENARNIIKLEADAGAENTQRRLTTAIECCEKALTNNDIIALPTDTIYGVATRAQSSAAVRKLYDLKGRNFFKPIAICVANVDDVKKYGDTSELPEGLLNKLLPGPVTVILRRTSLLNPDLNPYTNVVGIRVPDCDFVLGLMKSLDNNTGPLALTSANRAGETSAVCVEDFKNLWDNISVVVDGGKVGQASTSTTSECKHTSPTLSTHQATSREGSTIVDLSVKGTYSIVRDGSALDVTVSNIEAHGLVRKNTGICGQQPAYDVALLDIEGTTTPITFVHDVLFPYAKANVESYLTSNWHTKDCQFVVEQLRALAKTDSDAGTEGTVVIPEIPLHAVKDNEKTGENSEMDGQKRINMETVIREEHEDKQNLNAQERECMQKVVESVQWLMASDRKVGPLKQLQGRIWAQAYQAGEVKGSVYEDVEPCIDAWREAGVKVYIYSSGSIAAQKLLFQYSDKGDMLPHFSGHFDTTIGSKLNSSSYTSIANEIGVTSPSRVLFCTDNILEAEAARKAGMTAVVLLREGNASIEEDRLKHFLSVQDFSRLPSATVPQSTHVSRAPTPTLTRSPEDEPKDKKQRVE
eukprot:CFRG4029T1